MISKLSCMLILAFACAPAWALTLVSQGSSSYVIVIADKATPAERTAAQELAQHIETMSGAKLPVVSDAQFSGAHGILLGNNRLLDRLGIAPNWKQLGTEGYLLRVVDEHLIIAGGRPRGTLYGVYWLLEKYLDCRWFTPDTTVIPKRTTVTVPALDITGKPAFKYREPWMYVNGRHNSDWWRDRFSQAYVARTRNSGYRLHWAKMDERHGGRIKIPYYGHNLGTLVSPEEYGDTHPEYYALQPDGGRVTTGPRGYLSLCLTHPEVINIASQTMAKWMRADPDSHMFFVGQSDSGKITTCQCDKCRAVREKYSGRHSGENIEFVNQIARQVEKEFPDVRIGTFAYSKTYQAPANIKAHRNVVVWFCPITRCFCHPINQGLINKGFYHYIDELTAWSKIASELYVYDYSHRTQASTPPHDLLSLPETVDTYRRLGVEGIFVDALPDPQVGFGYLRYWLMTQLFNDANFDFDQGLTEFLDAYYGAAAGDIRRFIDMTNDPTMYAPATAKRAAIWYPQGSAEWKELRHNCLVGWRHLSMQAIETGYAIFEKARRAVADDPKALEHVLSARMVVQHAMLEYLPTDDPRLKDEAISFPRQAEKLKMRSIREVPLYKYRQQLLEKFGGP